MSIRVKTEHLLGLLADLTHTAAAGDIGGINGILLHTARGYLGDDPGKTDLLIGTSTNGRATGQTYVPCERGISEPMLWTLGDVAKVRAVLAPSAKDDKNHSVDLSRDLETCTIQEPPDLFDEGDSLTFHLGDLAKFPRGLWKLLDYQPPADLPKDHKGNTVPRAPRLDLTTGMLAPFVAVAKTHKTEIQLYVTHQEQPVTISIGGRYRGVLLPYKWSNTEPAVEKNGARPDGEIYTPDLPPVPKNVDTKAVGRAPVVVQLPLPASDPFVKNATKPEVTGPVIEEPAAVPDESGQPRTNPDGKLDGKPGQPVFDQPAPF